MVQIKSRKRKFHSIEDLSERFLRTEDGAEFQVSQELMSAKSEYFKKLFLYDSHHTVLVRGVSGEAIRSIISYIETGNAVINPGNIDSLLRAADYLKLDDFLKQIVSSLRQNICLENCINLYSTAIYLQHLHLNQIPLYVLVRFEKLSANSKFLDLTFELFEPLLSDNNLVVNDEETVWRAIVKWIEFDKERREGFLPFLLRCIRLEVCDESFFQNMLDHPILQESQYSSIASQSNSRSCGNVSLKTRFIERIRSLSPELVNLGPRQFPLKHCHVAISGYRTKTMKISISPVEDVIHSEKLICDCTIYFIPKFVVSCGHKILMFDLSKNRHAVDLMKASRTSFSSPPQDFDRNCFAHVDEQIFAFLMKRNSLPYVTAAVYELGLNKWRLLSSFGFSVRKARIESSEAAVLDGLIYVLAIAHNEKFQVMLFGSVYNPKTDAWSAIHVPRVPVDETGYFLTMVAYREALYLIWSESKEVYKFDPRLAAWEPFQKFSTPDFPETPRAVVWNGSLIAYNWQGYLQSDWESRRCWDEDLERWRSTDVPTVLTCEVKDLDVLMKYI